MGFKEKLTRMCERADRVGLADQRTFTRELAQLLSGVLKNERWGELPFKTQNTLAETAALAVYAADTVDAVDYIDSRLLAAANGSIIDLRLTADLRTVQSRIYQLFENKEAPRRGFVYVAWRGKPEAFYYVGKASTVDRLNLAQHGKLAHATTNATSLSLLFPSQSRDEILLDLEASVLRVIEVVTGAKPELNDQRPAIPDGPGSDRLGALSAFLAEVADEVNPFRG